ncbi:hypothetical protein C8R43DRAFT_1128398 [Mycena crocata]|nr:hypothetical protein C8R43DRAFT_1128398 [Mycena crocata]
MSSSLVPASVAYLQSHRRPNLHPRTRHALQPYRTPLDSHRQLYNELAQQLKEELFCYCSKLSRPPTRKKTLAAWIYKYKGRRTRLVGFQRDVKKFAKALGLARTSFLIPRPSAKPYGRKHAPEPAPAPEQARIKSPERFPASHSPHPRADADPSAAGVHVRAPSSRPPRPHAIAASPKPTARKAATVKTTFVKSLSRKATKPKNKIVTSIELAAPAKPRNVMRKSIASDAPTKRNHQAMDEEQEEKPRAAKKRRMAAEMSAF